ncbi:MAG: phosphatidate cytidylyltransferase [Chitinophagaceae bacterium]|nr:MAG: phosphatidate cytidylyltransferase [Chitinophagaceae bacterium]
MKKSILSLLFVMLFTMVTLSSCGAVETVFKAGMWWAFFLVALVIIVIIWLVGKARK